jgi:hypothetical protein
MAEKKLITEHKVRRPKDARPGRAKGADKQDVLELLRAQQVRFIGLQF